MSPPVELRRVPLWWENEEDEEDEEEKEEDVTRESRRTDPDMLMGACTITRLACRLDISSNVCIHQNRSVRMRFRFFSLPPPASSACALSEAERERESILFVSLLLVLGEAGGVRSPVTATRLFGPK